MLPDFSKPAFGFVALVSLEIEVAGSRKIRSDYRCQLRYSGDARAFEVRVYLVGSDSAEAGAPVPALLAFLDPTEHQQRCKFRTRFELAEGEIITAKGVVEAVATR